VLYEVDAVLDGDRMAALNLMDLTPIQFEAYRIFAGLLPGESPVWIEARRAMVAYMEMIAEQREFAVGRRDLLGLTYADAVRMAHNKSSLAMVATEARLTTALSTVAQGRPCVAIAHNLSIATAAHLVVVVDGGRVVDAGTQRDLLLRCRAYQRLHGWGSAGLVPEAGR
jgi:hypothetical protein